MTSEIETESKTSEEMTEIKIEELKPKMSNLVTTFKVVGISEPREVTSRHSYETHRVADATVGDETGVVTVPLWNESIEEMKVGKTYRLENGYTGLFRGNLQLKISRQSTVTEVDEEIETVKSDVDMSAENHRRQRDRGYYPQHGKSRGYARYNPNSSYRTDRRSRRDNFRRRRW
jgi:replication factor A1